MSAPKPAGPPPLLLAAVITLGIVGSWVVLGALDIFDSLGTKLTVLILGADVLAIGVIWAVFLRRDLSRRR
jgi:hypothetical protein